MPWAFFPSPPSFSSAPPSPLKWSAEGIPSVLPLAEASPWADPEMKGKWMPCVMRSRERASPQDPVVFVNMDNAGEPEQGSLLGLRGPCNAGLNGGSRTQSLCSSPMSSSAPCSEACENHFSFITIRFPARNGVIDNADGRGHWQERDVHILGQCGRWCPGSPSNSPLPHLLRSSSI